MAINQIRMGRSSLPAEIDLDVGDEYRLNQARREASQKAKLDLAIAAAAEGDNEISRKAAAKKAEQELGRQGVMRNYINDREQVGQINLGVVAPEYAPKQDFGPQVEKPDMRPNLAPIERKARIDLANINPDYSEQFRTGLGTERETDAARQRLANADTRAADKEKNDLTQQTFKNNYDTATQAETARHNRVDEVLKKLGITTTADTARAKTTKPIDPMKLAKLKGSIVSAITEINNTQDVLKRLQNHPGLNGLTGFSGKTPFLDIPGGKTNDAEALRQQLTAKSAFAELQKMRASSPTGGALGQVSDKEEQMLSNAAAALQRGQSPEQFAQNLKLFNDLLESSKANLRDAYKTDYGEDLPEPGTYAPPAVDVGDWQ